MSWSWNELILFIGVGYAEINKMAMDDVDERSVYNYIYTRIDILVINVGFGSFAAFIYVNSPTHHNHSYVINQLKTNASVLTRQGKKFTTCLLSLQFKCFIRLFNSAMTFSLPLSTVITKMGNLGTYLFLL